MTWDEQVAEICRWCTKHGAVMIVPKAGPPRFMMKRSVYNHSPATEALAAIRALKAIMPTRVAPASEDMIDARQSISPLPAAAE